MGLLIPESAVQGEDSVSLPPVRRSVSPARTVSAPQLEARSRPVSLFVERGVSAGQLIPLTGQALVIGRSAECQLRLQDESVSRHHALVSSRQGRFYLTDTASRHGTFVNQVRLTAERELHAGDQISIGAALLSLRGAPRPIQAPQVPMPKPANPSPATLASTPQPANRVAAARPSAIQAPPVPMPKPANRTSAARPSAIQAPAIRAPRPADRYSAARRWGAVSAAAVVVALAGFALGALRAPKAGPTWKLPSVERVKARAAEEAEAAAALRAPAPVQPVPPSATLYMPPPRDLPRAQARPTPVEARPMGPLTGRHNPAILSRYDLGNVEAAMELADQEEDLDLFNRLQRFSTAYDAGLKAMADKKNASAIRHFNAALALDRELAKGRWGKYGPRLRGWLKELSR